MGGFGSSRWTGTITRTSTAGLPRLDARVLARSGGLCPGALVTVTWGAMASASTEVTDDDPAVVTLRYWVRTRLANGQLVQERIGLMWTGCTFGGRRVWFVCPGCTSRRAVLYGLQARFRCRECHRLAYASTRKPKDSSGWTGPEAAASEAR